MGAFKYKRKGNNMKGIVKKITILTVFSAVILWTAYRLLWFCLDEIPFFYDYPMILIIMLTILLTTIYVGFCYLCVEIDGYWHKRKSKTTK